MSESEERQTDNTLCRPCDQSTASAEVIQENTAESVIVIH